MKKRIVHKLKSLKYSFDHIDPITRIKIPNARDSITIGNSLANWTIPKNGINENSVCFLAGAGEDISFDIAIANTYNCSVITLDPTPKALEHFKKVKLKKGDNNPITEFSERTLKYLKFVPIGIWKENTTIKFYAPENPSHVSHSIVNLQRTEKFFEAEVNTLSTLMTKEGFSNIDLLKIDIEGAEYEVIKSFIAEGIRPNIFCVEYDEVFNPIDSGYISRIKESLELLFHNGYKLYHLDYPGNYTLVQTT